MQNFCKTAEFGFLPKPLDTSSGNISIETLPDFEPNISFVFKLAKQEGDENWIFAPSSSRIFDLPKTHKITLNNAESDEHLNFIIWTLSFFLGVRLSHLSYAFVVAAPLKEGALVDFTVHKESLNKLIHASEYFWQNNKNTESVNLLIAIINCIYLAKNPKNFSFEVFNILYISFDACYKLYITKNKINPRINSHKKRIHYLCDAFYLKYPKHFDYIVDRRNEMMHEGLLMGQPLGFEIISRGENGENILLEMGALICRFLVALIGLQNNDYVRSPINTRQIMSLDL